jgi:hypothetical protein
MKKIIVIIAGGRDFTDRDLLFTKMDQLLISYAWKDITIVSGCARGADSLAIEYAMSRKTELVYCPADWDTHGKRAGYIRNSHMATLATHLVAFHDGKSRGTQMMIEIAREVGLATRVIRY